MTNIKTKFILSFQDSDINNAIKYSITANIQNKKDNDIRNAVFNRATQRLYTNNEFNIITPLFMPLLNGL